jgi:hypothetical protein
MEKVNLFYLTKLSAGKGNAGKGTINNEMSLDRVSMRRLPRRRLPGLSMTKLIRLDHNNGKPRFSN